MHYDLAILGAGAAGMIAAVAAAEASLTIENRKSKIENPLPLRVALFEKNSQPGVKVLVCGGGRCNFTNAGSIDFLIAQFGRNGRFLTPALRHLDNDALRHWFADRGVPSHEEHHGKIYPDSNRAKSVVDALVNRMQNLGVQIHTGPAGTVAAVQRSQQPEASSQNFLLTTASAESHSASVLLLAMGGMSYQKMGTTGDGYRIAQSLGHSLVTPRPAIVGLLIKEDWPRELTGLAVPDIEARIHLSAVLPKLATGNPAPSVNDLLFTHFGLSGPAILNLSEIVAELLEKFPEGVPLKIDFARHHTHEQLHALFRTWQQHHGKTLIRKILTNPNPEITITSTSPDQTAIPQAIENRKSKIENFSLPRRLAEKIADLELIPPDQTCSTLSSPQIHKLIQRLKSTILTVHATRGFKEAMVTAGGISLSEINPNTLESKITPNLFITGEVLDLTGPSGGYNLQLAFSTGHLAGTTIAHRLNALPSEPRS